MKIGGEYGSDKVLPKHFDLLAQEVGLARPMVKQRVLEMVEMVLAKTSDINIDHPTAAAVLQLIQGRCAKTSQQFKR